MITQLIRDDLKEFIAYETASLVNEIPYIRLHANESPWSVSESNLNRYPKQLSRDIPAQYYEVKPEQLLATRGSNEGIDLMLRLFCKSGEDEVLIVSPTFGMYSIAAQIQGVKTNIVELEEEADFQFNIDSIISGITAKTKLVFICSPNNPTGNSMSITEIEKLCINLDGKGIVIIDEAYIEFSDVKSATSLINKYGNLVVLRTLSKAFGMAGIRAGFVIADQKLIQALQSIIPPYPIPTPCVQLIETMLSSEKIVQMWINTTIIRNSRAYLKLTLNKLGLFEKILISDGNFLFAKTNDATELQQYLKEGGILLRKFNNLNNYLRVSVGSNEENQKLIELLKKWEPNREK